MPEQAVEVFDQDHFYKITNTGDESISLTVSKSMSLFISDFCIRVKFSTGECPVFLWVWEVQRLLSLFYLEQIEGEER